MKHVGASYKQTRLEERWDAIVVGSGVGGLTAAALLAKRGRKRVLVLERHYTAGGYSHVFHRPGFEWDVGVHYVGQVGEGGALRAAFDEISEGRLQWARMPEVYDRAVIGEQSYDFVAGHAAFIERMSSYFPGQTDAIARYVALCREATRAARWYYVDKAVKPWASALLSVVLNRGLLHHAGRSTFDVLRSLTPDSQLLAVLATPYGDYGLPPKRSSFAAHALTMTHYLGGAWYPVGGASAIARSIEPTLTAWGGLLCTSAEVDRITVENGRASGVQMVDGRTLKAPVVISDAGVALTYGRLLRERGLARPSPSTAPSSSWVCLYVGLDRSDQELEFQGTNWWLFPGNDHDAQTDAFERDSNAPFPVVFASFPSAKDPSWAGRYPGRATMELVAPVRYEWFSAWQDSKWKKRGPHYEDLKTAFQERLLAVLYARWPQTRGHVQHAELSTPLSARTFTAHPSGELYGLSADPARFLARIRARTEVHGLYLTGADLAMAGVSGALVGGVVTASSLLGLKVMTELLSRKKVKRP